MKKTSMAASALLNSIIQLSQYYEEKSPLLYTLVVCTFRHLPWWPLYTKTWFSLVFIFLCFLIASRHCVGVWGPNYFSRRTHPHRRAENGCKDTHTLTHIVKHTQTSHQSAESQRHLSFSAPVFHSLVHTLHFLSLITIICFISGAFSLTSYIRKECRVCVRRRTNRG